jgi:hypothetical protein
LEAGSLAPQAIRERGFEWLDIGAAIAVCFDIQLIDSSRDSCCGFNYQPGSLAKVATSSLCRRKIRLYCWIGVIRW